MARAPAAAERARRMEENCIFSVISGELSERRCEGEREKVKEEGEGRRKKRKLDFK